MKFVECPNLPYGKVKVVVTDGRINSEIEQRLRDEGIRVLKTHAYPDTYEAISYHPDIFLHHIGGAKIVYAPGCSLRLLECLLNLGFNLIKGGSVLSSRYPFDIPYNVARIGKYAIHNTKYTDSVLRKELEKAGVEFIHVNQGYSKCSVSIVNDTSIITCDRSIAKAAERIGMDVLLIEPDMNIKLPGVDRGFIGGSTGLIGGYKWAVSGNCSFLDAYCKIKKFVEGKNIEIISLSKGQIIDIGSILPLMEE